MEIIEIIKERLSIFKNLYDSIRVVDPINRKIVKFGEDNSEIIQEPCYQFQENHEECNNCIAMRAYLENDTFIKLEDAQGKVFLIISAPVTIENKVYIVEMIKDISQTGVIVNSEKDIIEFGNLIKQMNKAAIKKI